MSRRTTPETNNEPNSGKNPRIISSIRNNCFPNPIKEKANTNAMVILSIGKIQEKGYFKKENGILKYTFSSVEFKLVKSVFEKCFSNGNK